MASSVVNSATQQLGKLLVEEAKYLYNVRDKIETLQKELTWMECFLKDADTQQYQEKVVQMWVFDIQDLAYDAEDIIVRYLNEVPHRRRDGVRNTIKWFSSIICVCDAWKLHNLSSDIDGLTVKISELTSRLQTYGIKVIRPTANSEYNVKIMEERRTYSHTHEDVVGIDEDIKEVVDRLVKTDYKVVVLSGIGGLGKTTLARKVFKHKDVKDHFNDNCAWVYISKEFEKENVFKLILLELEKSEQERKRIRELQPQQLSGEIHKVLEAKRCLVVIDDIWTEEAWKSIKSGFESVCGATSASKILLTTRNQGMLQQVDPYRYDRPLKHLSDDESWKLLKRNAYIGQRSTPCTGEESSTLGQSKRGENCPQDVDRVTHEIEIEKLGKKMLKHCDGIPIAIVALGGILSHKRTISEWEEVSNNISSYLMGGMSQLDRNAGGILNVIELSFHDLPFYLKPCFLYLGNFPEDYKISTERLYNLWEAEGFLVIEDEVAKRRGSSYKIGERYLNELIQRCMVQVGECDSNGRVKECQLHDVMRDMCLRKCEEARFLNCIKGEQDSTASIEMKKWRRCVVNDGKEDTIDKQFEHGERAIGVRSLLVFQREVMLSKIWKCFPLLRALDLEGVTLTNAMDMDGVGLLIHLRYLSIRKTELRILPSSLYDLRCLETLDLRGRTKTKLLNKFDQMKRLRHLYLPKWFEVEGGKKLKFPCCSLMETIKNFDTSKCESEEVMQMTKLRVFSIGKDHIIQKREEVKLLLEAPVIKNEGQLLNSFRLQIKGNIVKEDPGILCSAAQNPCFNKLKIQNPFGSEGELLGGGKGIVFWESLTKVEILFFDIMDTDMLALGKLPRLNYLYLIGFLGNKLSLPPGSFPNLTFLILSTSDKLQELNVGDGALPILRTLYLSRWKAGFTLSALEMLCNLKYLDLSGIGVDKLNFWDGIFPQLGHLEINHAKELKELSFDVGALPNLQTFKLGWCEKLTKLTNIPKTITKVELRDGDLFLLDFGKLPRLQRLYIGGGSGRGKKLMFSAGSFPNLSQLEIYNHEMEELEVGIGSLANLQHLDLYSCPKLKKLPEGLPPSLKITLRPPDVAATRFKWLPRRLKLPSTTN